MKQGKKEQNGLFISHSTERVNVKEKTGPKNQKRREMKLSGEIAVK